MKIKFALVSLAWLALSILNSQLATAFAQGAAFTYQGRLQNNGSPASGTYNLTFSLFNTNTGGVPIAGPVTNNAVSVTNGLFTVPIDFGPGAFAGATNWLEIAVETNGGSAFTTLAPRQQLTPTPYAIYAESASGLSGTLSASQLTSIGNTNGGSGNFFVGPSGNATTSGNQNIAIGDYALYSNTSGYDNTAIGSSALSVNMSGSGNTANGVSALSYNANGSYNTAIGLNALEFNTSGNYNTANGFNALFFNTIGSGNTAYGVDALFLSTNGSYSTAIGYQALLNNTSGSENIALGAFAGYNFTGSESGNIDIGNSGVTGENNTIRIGSGQSQTFIAGVINGNGAGLTNLSAAKLTGVLPLAQLPPAVLTNNESGVTLSGTFSGNGAGLTGLNASQLTGGTLPLASLPVPLTLSAATGGSLISANNGASDEGIGVSGAGSMYGLYGVGSGPGSYGVYGWGGEFGVYGIGSTGLRGIGYGSGITVAVEGSGGTWAGYFDGNVYVASNIYFPSGSLKIDDPLDPANKYLSHSFIESPDMKNIYDGVTVLDGNGEAVVQLPDWFEALNRDFRYQLTAIGAPGPNLYIAGEIAGNQFKIAGGGAGMKVSWQVTGIRQDAYANAHRIPVEEAKPASERGLYLHPELFGQPAEKKIGPPLPRNMPALPSAPPKPADAPKPANASG